MTVPAECWCYDRSAEGLVELCLRSLETGRAPAFVAGGRGAESSLFDPPPAGPAEELVAAEAGTEAAERLRAASPRLLGATLRAWMSEEAVEAALLAVAAAFGARGEEVLGDFGSPELRLLAASARRVNREIHRLLGLARFSRRRDGLYVALLEPDHDVLPAIAPAFLPRFGSAGDPLFAGEAAGGGLEAFALVDLRRRYALFRPGGDRPAPFELLAGEAIDTLLPDGSDGGEEELWRGYLRAVDNPARRNPALQRRLMPRRYWKHLVEMSGT